jgi:Fe2+ transport system protein FeoA
VGQFGIIRHIDSDLIKNKLFDLGFYEGAILQPTRISLNKSTFCFKINNSVFAIRRKDAEKINVTVEI